MTTGSVILQHLAVIIEELREVKELLRMLVQRETRS